MTWELAGYSVMGPAKIWFLAWRWLHPVRVQVAVVRNAGRGGGWFRFSRKTDDTNGWNVTHYDTLLEATPQ